MSENETAEGPLAETRNLIYEEPCYSNLSEWIGTLSKSSDFFNTHFENFSRNAFLYLSNHRSVSKDKARKSNNEQTSVIFHLQLQATDVNSKKIILSSILTKIEDRKKILAEIEALEFGVSLNTAYDRITLWIQLLKGLLSLGKPKSLPQGMHRIFDELIGVPDSFLELCWWVIISLLDGLSVKLFQVVEPALLSALLLKEIIGECTQNCRISFELAPEPAPDPDSPSTTENFTGKRTPMVVFSNADINSALDAGVNAAWFTEGLVPWATSCILVQEGIHSKFIAALKKRLQLSAATISITHSSLNINEEYENNMKEILSRAKEMHLEIFQVTPTRGNHQSATLIIGDFLSVPTSLSTRSINTTLPVLFVVPFRKIQEGIAMANSSTDKIAASVWSESFSQCLSTVTQLDFDTIWVNSHGIFDSVVPFYNRVSSCEPHLPTALKYVFMFDLRSKSSLYFENSRLGDGEMQVILNAAYKECLNWGKKDYDDYIEILNQVWVDVDPKTVAPDFKQQLVDSFCGQVTNTATVQVKNCFVSSTVKAIGVIIFFVESKLVTKQMLLKLILSAIFSKNTVIVLGKEHNFDTLTSALPEGVLQVTERYPWDALCSVVSEHKQGANMSVWRLGDDYFDLFERQDGHLFKYYTFLKDVDIRAHVVRKKVVWMPFS